jgi:hypothetical protein
MNHRVGAVCSFTQSVAVRLVSADASGSGDSDVQFNAGIGLGGKFPLQDKRRTAEAIGSLWGEGEYITTLAISPAGRYLYAIPRAHGDAWKIGAPVVQYDLQTRTPKVLAFLGPYYRDAYAYLVGGSYCLELSQDGSRLFFGTNGSAIDGANPGFGLPTVLFFFFTQRFFTQGLTSGAMKE